MTVCASVIRRFAGLLLPLVVVAAVMLGAPGSAAAAVACPNANPVVNENNCNGAGTTAYRLTNYSENLAGFSTKTSFDKGEAVPLKIARSTTGTRVNVAVYRMGYYGGTGGRLIPAAGASNLAVSNTFTCNPADAHTGLRDCGNWGVTYTIPGSALPVSGVYVAKLTSADSQALQNWIVFTVRDDQRATPAKLLYVLPVSSYQAYNTWGGKSLYFDKNGGADTVSGNQRAVKVSFNRPLDGADNERNRFFGPDADLVSWLEQQGYDVSYTDDLQVHSDRAELLKHRVIVLSGHGEYWSGEQLANVKAARDTGVSVASFSSNTAYWKVRYENNGRTLVCYKTVQGSGASGSGAAGANDEGPDGVKGTADDALGADQIAGTADDHPENATTTMRDNGAPNGDPNAPPGGRVGPDTPENALLGNMYVGDNEARDWPLAIPATNTNAEYSGDRVWRNTGISTSATTTIAGNMVGWEWDSIPTQAQYLAKQPGGVKRLTSTTTSDPGSNWIQDEGRVYASTPPPGQPATTSAVKYKAPSGATVFSAGTNQWAYGLGDTRIAQATYNLLSDMGTQPLTPLSTIVLDPAGANQTPTAAFNATPNPAHINQTVTFDATLSSDADGTLAKFEWDLDGNGTFETNTGTTRTVTRVYTTAATVDVRLRVTDNAGATDVTTRSLSVVGNFPPTASFTASPNPAAAGQTVSLDAAASADSDGTIAKLEWDLDGNGSYERDTGTTRTTTTSYASAGTYNVGLRVTDNEGATATATVPVSVTAGGVSSYGDTVLATPGLARYWRMGEAAGPALADSTGGASATATGGTFGVPGGPAGDPNTAVRFNGTSESARAAVSLASTSRVTVEFWLKWNAYANDDKLAMELTPNFNGAAGGFLVDPNAPQFGGTFGVAIGNGGSRNNVFFARPSAGAWHHYALVFDSTAPAATQITPYVDGVAVSYQKGNSGTGAGPFANDTLFMMSRGGASLFGPGDLDEVALYTRTLDAATIREHAAASGTNRRPVAAFTISPNPARPGTTVTFDGSASTDPGGSITRYRWDLDGNGSYETDTGSTAQVTRSYATTQTVDVGLQVTDNQFAQDTETHTLVIGNGAPTASFTAQPSPAIVGQTVTFDATASTDSDGTIAKLEWDLDGNGTYERDTGTTRTTTTSYAAPGTYNVGLRVTDNDGATGTKTVPLTVNSGNVSNYGDTVLATPGLARYWRMGETAGPALADSTGGASATATGGTFGVPGGPSGDPNTAVRFNGTSDFARATVDLSSTSRVTVEFWLKWNAYANDDKLAMELTPNFNATAGGILVDPNASQFGGTFGVAIGTNATRNNVFFARPSAGAWHHYALVLDTTAPAATQITPYVDGVAVAYQKGSSNTGSGAFAASTLYLMSRAGTTLFGAGDLDEVALYTRALDAATIGQHAGAAGTNRRPVPSFTATPSTATTGQTVQFDASASSDPDGTIARYEWDLDGNGSYETDTGSTKTTSRAYTTTGTVAVGLRVTDDRGATATTTNTVVVSDTPPASGSYATQVLATTGLVDYWRMGDPGPTLLRDAKGTRDATLHGGLAGVPGAPAGGTDTAVRFNGTADWADAPVDLSATSTITVEFWLRWDAFGTADDLAMELTPNFNQNPGGFLIDPDAGGSFGVGVGLDTSRNTAYFTPPSAGVWHHYAFVLDTTAPAASQVTPYVDGVKQSFTKGASGTGAGPFAASTLYMMSRAGTGLFGAGTLDEVALYTQALSASTIAAHAAAGGT